MISFRGKLVELELTESGRAVRLFVMGKKEQSIEIVVTEAEAERLHYGQTLEVTLGPPEPGLVRGLFSKAAAHLRSVLSAAVMPAPVSTTPKKNPYAWGQNGAGDSP